MFSRLERFNSGDRPVKGNKITFGMDMIFQGKLIKPHLLIFSEGDHRCVRY